MAGYRFDRFTLDPTDRRLLRDGAPVEVSARYFDALALLVAERGKLVSKDRFMDDVWRGVPVTDEALTQCVKTLRRLLGDDAARPRFIETVPKHGYRFVASVEDGDAPAAIGASAPASATAVTGPWRRVFLLAGAGTLGAGVAGMIGGLIYGFAGAAQPETAGTGGASVLLVILWLTLAAALTGGAGVSLGIAIADRLPDKLWRIAGGAIGGLVVGGLVKLFGLDAFNLLLGKSPAGMTGAFEGLLLGGGVGLGAWLTSRTGPSLRRAMIAAGLASGAVAATIPLLGGRLMAGSLDHLARTFPGSRLRLDALGRLTGEADFGPVAQIVTAALEGLLFGACIAGAMLLARRSLDRA